MSDYGLIANYETPIYAVKIVRNGWIYELLGLLTILLRRWRRTKKKHTTCITIVAIHDPGYEMKRKKSDLFCGKKTKIQRILVPTVPMIDKIIGTTEYPIPRKAPGNRSIIPQRKYGTVVIDRISKPHRMTSGSSV